MVRPKTQGTGLGNGGVAPPKKYQFGQPNGNPQGRGFWKVEDTPRYKLEKMMKLSQAELKAIVTDENAPYFERKLATCINKGEWNVIKDMIQEVYGRPKETVIQKIEVSDPYEGLTTEELRELLRKRDSEQGHK